jgi:chaperonin cofactor prefoldin
MSDRIVEKCLLGILAPLNCVMIGHLYMQQLKVCEMLGRAETLKDFLEYKIDTYDRKEVEINEKLKKMKEK